MDFVELHELPDLIRAIRSYKNRALAIGLELFVLLLCRPGELRLATWQQFDFKRMVWEKPASNTKTKNAHAVPLSKQAIKLLNELKQLELPSNYLFPGRYSMDTPISDGTFNKALKKLGYAGRQDPHGFRHIASTALNNAYSDKSQVIESALRLHTARKALKVYTINQPILMNVFI